MTTSIDDTESRNPLREAMENQENLLRADDATKVDSEGEKLQRLEQLNNAGNENDGWNNAGKLTSEWNNVGWGDEFKDEDNVKEDKWSGANGWGEKGEDFREENNGKGAANGWNDWGEEFKDEDNRKDDSWNAEVPEARDHDSSDKMKRKNDALRSNRGLRLPMRTGAEDCAFYMKTGSCKFGSGCKFNHPPRGIQSTKEVPKGSKPACKFHMRPEGCKFGDSCKFLHSIEKPSATQSKSTPSLELNSFGLPIRPGENQCSYYIRNGSCKFGSTCRFHHPDFSVAVKSEPPSKPLTNPSYEPVTAPIKNGFQNGDKDADPVDPSSNKSEFPERPEQPECTHFVKTGYCKFKSSCKFHHPKSQPSCALSEKGLPLRPDQSVCAFYGRYGICKFGPSCRFNHPIQP